MVNEKVQIAKTVKGIIASEWGTELGQLDRFINEAENLPSAQVLDEYNAAVADYQQARSSRARADALDEVLRIYSQNTTQLAEKEREIQRAVQTRETQEQIDNLHLELGQALDNRDTTKALEIARNLQGLYADFGDTLDDLDGLIAVLETYPSTEVAERWDVLVEEFESSSGNQRLALAQEVVAFYEQNSNELVEHEAEVSVLKHDLETLDVVQENLEKLAQLIEDGD